MRSALASLALGLSEAESGTLVEALAPGGGSTVPLSRFEAKLVDAFISPEVQQIEAWARRSLEPFSSHVAVFLRERDKEQRGVLPIAAFCAALRDLLLDVSKDQQDVLVLLAAKSRQGEIDYMTFADSFGAPPPPPPPLPDCSQPGSLLEDIAPPPAPPESETPRSLFGAASMC
mmetsp:Transcript_87140/g.255041  ORF Transcript_87140/g.255041 Transcript_87140/m.255041 type:complete len:174 (+) Transcript_87140:817-1338(+)